jgi:thiol-disulfide isomerase/thioredoxin
MSGIMSYLNNGKIMGGMRIFNKSTINNQFSMKRIFFTGLIFLFVAHVKGQEIKKVKITELEKIITESKTPLIINFWATWCKPCLEEIPYFQKEVQAFAKDSVQLILVSVDYNEEFPKGIAATAKKRKIIVPILWLDETNADYFCPKVDSKWSGSVPATLFINNKTGHRKFFEGQLSKEKLKEEIMAIL